MRSSFAIIRLRKKLQEILIKLQGKLSVDVLTLFLYDKQTDQFDLPVGQGPYDLETFEDPRMLPRRGRAARKIIQTKKPLFAENAQAHSEIKGAFIYRENIRSSAGFPLISGDEVFGVLFISFRHSVPFDPSDQKKLSEVIQNAANEIYVHIDFSNLRNQGYFPLENKTGIYQPISDLFAASMDMPTAIWLLDPQMQSLNIKASSGLPPRYVVNANASIGDGSIISGTIENGKRQTLNEITVNQRYAYRKHLVEAKLKSSTTVPIFVGDQAHGVIELFDFKESGFSDENFEHYKQTTLRHLTDMTALIIMREVRSQESKKLAELAHTISSSFDFNRVIKEIVHTARDLTLADSSVINLIGDQSSMFGISNTFSCSIGHNCKLCHDDELNRYIIEKKESLILHDVSNFPKFIENAMANRLRKIMLDKGIRSLIAVPVYMPDEHFGVLYACGRRKFQFNDHHVSLMQNLAYQLSIIIGRPHHLLKATQEIDRAISELSRKKEILETFCKDIKTELGFGYVTVSMRRFDDNIIEVITGTGFGKEWSGLSKHSLVEIEDEGASDKQKHAFNKSKPLKDIQADIVLSRPPRTEIISGWDDRFEKWIYEEFNHELIVRVTTPIIVLLDHQGNVVEDWPESLEWKIVKDEKKADGKQHTVLELATLDPEKIEKGRFKTFVVGTVGAGYKITVKPRIEPEEAISLNKFISRNICKIRKILLHNVLQKIVDRARQIVSADSASLHFQQTEYGEGFVYEVCAGKIGLPFLKSCRPRKNGLGEKAILEEQAQFISLESQNQRDKALTDEKVAHGIKAEAVFPLKIGERNGVLYIYFNRNHVLTDNEKEWLKFFADKAVAAIQHATTYKILNEQTLQLAKLNEISWTLTQKTTLEENLLLYIANSTRMLLAADVVVIYEYDMNVKKFETTPQISGRLFQKLDDKSPVTDESTPMRLISNYNKNPKEYEHIYETDVRKNAIFFSRNRKTQIKEPLFIEREKIRSAAGILLIADEEIVGTMFVNYRRPHSFSDNEREIIATLASSAALAIKNQRSLQDRQDELMTMAHDFKGSLLPILTALDRIKRKYNLPDSANENIDYAISFAENLSIITLGTYRWLSQQTGRPVSDRKDPIDTKKELEQLTKLLQFANNRDDLTFEIKDDEEFPKVLMDKDIFTVVMYGLLENAVKYTDKRSTVTLSLGCKKNKYEIRIKSIGQPIPPDEKERIFEKFERAQIIRGRRKKGTGIGLWAMRKLMRAINGDLYLDSTDSVETSEFVVVIPQDK